MPMKRGIWLILAAAILVLIGLFVRPTTNRTPETPPAAQTPASGQHPAKNAGDAGPTQKNEQKAASAPAPEAAQRETTPAPQAAAPSQTPAKETAPEPAPRPATAPSSRTAGNETPPAPAATAPTGTAPTSGVGAAAPAPPTATAVQTAPKEAAPASAPQPAAAPSTQTAEKESVPTAASSPAAAPAATAGEKASVAMDKDAEPHVNDKASAELAALQPAFVPKDLVAALNDSVISFATDSADVPASTTGLLQKAAEDLKQLPKGHVVEIAGYTDNTGDQALNGALSQKRAEAVRQALIKFGADPEMLIARGYGGADPVASNDTPEGRQRNRRIEYRIVKSP
jgi:outer membrane protein OmpA-like peptidoglycan-associated protein